MKIGILSGNPKTQGLCQSAIDAAKQGALDGGAEVDEIRLCDYDIGRCHICGSGWGTCRNEGRCTFGSDGFDEVKQRLLACDAFIIATPVYWHETSEALKACIDRLRRCTFNQEDGLTNKQALLIASAGGTGNGLLTCLEQMERFCKHTGIRVYDMIGVNRWNSDYKRAAAKAAALSMASGREHGDTV